MPEATSTADENFSITFAGPAFNSHEISAAALAQSLLALDNLARRAAQAAYGRNADISVKVKGNPRPGSFIMNLLIQHTNEITTGAGALTILMGLFALGKWALGKKVKRIGSVNNNNVTISNDIGQTTTINASIVNIYDNSRTDIELSRFTQSLDNQGIDSITISSPDHTSESITKEDRIYFKHEDGIVITDSEATMSLEIIGAKFNGSQHGWSFSEGENEREYTARVLDDEFLRRVRDREIQIQNGTTILAIVRTVQKKLNRVVVDRYIIEVIEVRQPEN